VEEQDLDPSSAGPNIFIVCIFSPQEGNGAEMTKDLSTGQCR